MKVVTLVSALSVRDAASQAAETPLAAAQDTATQTAATPARVGPPDTSYYMKLGYIVAGVIFAAYILLMLRRIASVRRSS